jgi:integrase
MAPQRVRGGWRVRIRFGKGGRDRFRMPDLSEPDAIAREARLERMARRLVECGLEAHGKAFLTEAAAAADDAEFAQLELEVERRCAESEKARPPKQPKTFRDVAELWLNGELHRRFPDRVQARDPETDSRDRFRLAHICQTIGDIPLAKLTRQDAERALARVPRHLMPATRSKYAALIPRVLRLAELAGYLDRSPLPTGWAPGAGEGREFQFLYVEEDAALMKCKHVPLDRRILWGFLVREGTRVSEALALTWTDINFDRRSIVIRKSKTGRMRRWRLGEDVARALELYQERTGAGGDERVFGTLKHRTAQTFREDLKRCQINRRELHEGTAESRHVTVHDLRGSFVTMSLAREKPEQWIMDRTGHTTSKMLHVYDRASRFARDHEMTWYGPLDTLLFPGHSGEQPGETKSEDQPLIRSSLDSEESETDIKRSGHASLEEPTSGQNRPGPGQDVPGGTDSPVEIALAAALEAATKAQRWDVVLEVTRELSERRRARTAPSVPSLDEARRRRENGDK